MSGEKQEKSITFKYKDDGGVVIIISDYNLQGFKEKDKIFTQSQKNISEPIKASELILKEQPNIIQGALRNFIEYAKSGKNPKLTDELKKNPQVLDIFKELNSNFDDEQLKQIITKNEIISESLLECCYQTKLRYSNAISRPQRDRIFELKIWETNFGEGELNLKNGIDTVISKAQEFEFSRKESLEQQAFQEQIDALKKEYGGASGKKKEIIKVALENAEEKMNKTATTATNYEYKFYIERPNNKPEGVSYEKFFEQVVDYALSYKKDIDKSIDGKEKKSELYLPLEYFEKINSSIPNSGGFINGLLSDGDINPIEINKLHYFLTQKAENFKNRYEIFPFRKI